MARRHDHNDSSGVRASLQPDLQSKECRKKEEEHDRGEHNGKKSSIQAGCSSSSSSSCTGATGGGCGPAKEDDRMQAKKTEDLMWFPKEDEMMQTQKKEKPTWTQNEDNPTWTKRKDDPMHPQKTDEPMKTQRDDLMRSHKEDSPSSCCLLEDLKKLPQCHVRLGQLEFSSTHNVLVDVGVFNSKRQLKPQIGRDVWHSDFVKMPSSQSSFMMIPTGFMRQPTKVRRWGEISKQLTSLAKKKTASVEDLQEAIFKYNPKYKGQWTFDALSTLVKTVPKAENYFPQLFPKIAELALKLPDFVKKAIPLLRCGRPASVTLSQVQISCLLANAFFCTFPHRNATTSTAEYHNYPTINFSSLFGDFTERKREKLRAIMHYFKVVTDENTQLRGLVTFERRCLGDTDMSNWRRCQEKMPKLHLTSSGTIESEGTGMLQVDFASSWIGGGVLGSGLVQEEILFLMNPELIVSRLFTEKLGDNECLIVTGSQQFSSYLGYSDSFEWMGPHVDHLQRDEWARLERQILAIDALHFRHRRDQFDMTKVTRELNKAYCGFKGHRSNEPDIATGKWGCGAFNGDPQLKAVIQLMAAARAKRGLAFFTFKDEQLKEGLQGIYHLLVSERTTVEKLFGLLEDFCAIQKHASGGPQVDLFEFIRENIRSPRSQL